MHRTIFYGQLYHILVCPLPDKPFWRSLRGTTRLLAVIHPCDIQLQGTTQDAAKNLVSFRSYTAAVIIDLAAISCVVGRVQTQKKWYIVDRSGGLVRTTFVSDDFEEGALTIRIQTVIDRYSLCLLPDLALS